MAGSKKKKGSSSKGTAKRGSSAKGSAKRSGSEKGTAKKGGSKKEIWEKENPKRRSTPLTPAQKAKATRAARAHGRETPSLVDNINAQKD